MCVCVCVSPLKQDYFWSRVCQVQIWYGSFRITFAPTHTWLCRIMILVRSFDKVPGSCIRVCGEQDVSDFSFYWLWLCVFIILFESFDPVVDNTDDFHRKIIEQSSFHDNNSFCGTVIHQSTFVTFQKNQSADRHTGVVFHTVFPDRYEHLSFRYKKTLAII